MDYKTFWIPSQMDYKECFSENPFYNKFFQLDNPERKDVVISVPDGCVNLYFLFQGNRCHARIVGSGVAGTRSMVSDNDMCFGVKFNAGMLPEGLMNKEKCITNENHDLNEYVNVAYLERQMEQGSTMEERIQIFLDNSADFGAFTEDCLTQKIISYINGEWGNVDISAMSKELGYCQPYLNRVFHKSVGMSMKQFACIIRCQYAFKQIKREDTDKICGVLGYYDQPHFIREFKKYSMMTPVQARRTNYQFV